MARVTTREFGWFPRMAGRLLIAVGEAAGSAGELPRCVRALIERYGLPVTAFAVGE